MNFRRLLGSDTIGHRLSWIPLKIRVRELEKIKLKQEAETKEALNKVEAAKIKAKSGSSGSDAESEQSSMDHFRTILKRELHIVGTIGTPGQKDQVSYISLNRQIEAAL